MEDPGIAFWITAVIAGCFVGLSKGGLPLIGTLSVPTMALVMNPVAAVGLLAPLYNVTDLFGLYAYRRAIDMRVIRMMAPGATLGVGIGWLAASSVPPQAVTGLIGLVGLTFALSRILPRGAEAPARAHHFGRGSFWGAAMGFTSFLSHAGGAAYQVYVIPLRLDKTVFAGTTTALFAYVNLIKLIPYWQLGGLSFSNLKITAFLVLPGALGVFAGVQLVKVIPQKLFFKAVIWALLILSIKLLWDAVTGWLHHAL